MSKKYVKVLVEFSPSGKKAPKIIYWDNGESFQIDKLIDVKNRPSMKAGGVGERYEIIIKGKRTYLFFEEGQWFVECVE